MRIKEKSNEPTSGELEADPEDSGQPTDVQHVAGVPALHDGRGEGESITAPSQPVNKTRRDSSKGQVFTPMTELQFLLELLLNHQLKKLTKDLIVARIKIVEQNLSTSTTTQLHIQPAISQPVTRTYDARGIQQAPSMAAKIQAFEQGQQPPAAPSQIPLSAMVGAAPRRLGDPAAGGSRIKDREVITGKGTVGPRKY